MGLKIIHRMAELPFGALMAVFETSNRERARENWPHLSQMEGLYRAEMEFYQYLRHDFFTMGDSFYALWEESGRIVSAVRFERWRDGWLLEGLETRPGDRGRGYACRLLAAALPEGKVYAHVHRANGASVAVHQKCGFRESGDTPMVDGSFLPGYITMVRELENPQSF